MDRNVSFGCVQCSFDFFPPQFAVPPKPITLLIFITHPPSSFSPPPTHLSTLYPFLSVNHPSHTLPHSFKPLVFDPFISPIFFFHIAK